MVNTRTGNVGLVEAARSIIAQATAEPLPPARPVLIIRTEQQARDWLGSDHGLEAFMRPGPAPAVYALPGAGGVLPALATVTVEGLGWPAPAAALHRLEVSHDPHGSPPVTCRVDGVPVALESVDGVWRPRREKTDG